MWVKFIKDFEYNGINFQAGTSYCLKNQMFARYVVRMKLAVLEA